MQMPMPVRTLKALDIEEEYKNTLRTESNARFFSSSLGSDQDMDLESLLEPHQDDHLILIHQVLQNIYLSTMRRRSSSEIELALADYFVAGIEALQMCRQLLSKIKSTQNDYQSMDGYFLACTSRASTPQPFPARSNPFSATTRSSFRQIHHKYSSILERIMSSHRKVARKLKIVRAVKKLIPKTRSLLRLQEMLDTTAKGAYVLGRDLDTVSHLVVRLSDGIDWENALSRHCDERSSEMNSMVEMVNELRRSCSSSRSLADELEEHVCLCLATIHRARVSVIQEIAKKA